MKYLLSFLILWIGLISIETTNAEKAPDPKRTYHIKGKIIDETDNEPMEYATIKLLQASDSSMVTGIVTDANGEFTIKMEQAGTYLLEIDFIGYEKQYRRVKLTPDERRKNLGTIPISPGTENLDEVTVEGNKHAIDYQIDKKVMHVSRQYSSVSGTAVDLLQNAPSIKVDIEGNVSLRGNSNFTVLIDNRPTVLDATEALEQVPASTIQDIEIITNPSAKYDPEGTAGIINIITKKRTLEGINGISHLNVGLDEKYGGDLLLNFRNEKFNVFVGGDYNKRTYPGSVDKESRTYKGDTTFYLTSEGDYQRKRERYSARAGFEWFPTEKDHFSISARYGSRSHAGSSTADFAEWNNYSSEKDRYTSIENGERGGNFLSLKSDYSHEFSKRKHKLDLQLMYYTRNGGDESISTLKNANDVIKSSQKSTEGGPATGMRYRINYMQPFSSAFKIEMGAQGRYRDSEEDNEVFYYNTSDGTYEFQPQFSNEVTYMRNIHAAYGLANGEIQNFGYQLGLRTEYTYRNVALKNTGENFNINRWDIFPTLHFSYQLTEKDQLMASYSRRIDRPRGWYLEPFITWEDAYNVRRGNPALQPEYINSFEVAYQKEFGDHAISIEGYHRTTENNIERIRQVYRDNIMLRTYANVGKDFSTGTEVMLNLQPVKFWETDFTGNFYNYRVKGQLNDVDFDEQSFTWELRWNNTITLWENTRIQLNPAYHSPEIEPQEKEAGYFDVDGAIRQSFMNKKLQATLQVRDILSTSRHESTIDEPDFYNYRLYKHKSPIVMLNVTWRINNYKNNKRGGRNDMEGGMEGGM